MPRRISTTRGREFGEGVRAVVAGSGLSSRQVAELVDCDESKVSEVLNGKVYLSRLEVAVLLSVCRPEAAERNRLLALYPTRHVLGWWQQYGKSAPIRPSTVLAHVAMAKELIDWQPHALPVFLRTDDYARELMIASATVPQEEIDERLRVQAEMRDLLRDRLDCTFFIHEFALRLQVGEPAVQAEQMLHLTMMANWAHVKIRVVPASVGAHAGMTGAFTQLKFPKYEPVVWLEALNSHTFVEMKDSIAGYEAVAGKLDDVSLCEQASLDMINRLQCW
ncbi:helix-turn-helix domain-containing protein [Lentzea sp. E54]|uniref:helix-turn-helix domain-containing protein n=1 Tax=Lentzea xerophila TaxID=3435883 RepID=UPI003DA5BB62